jgi:hypothetical protein
MEPYPKLKNAGKRLLDPNFMPILSHPTYESFLDRKSQIGGESGFLSSKIPDFLFGFQRFLVEWALRKGGSGIFADCGLGKTPMQLVWADAVVRHTNKPVLILTPLGVTRQTLRESEKFGIESYRSTDGTGIAGRSARIIVANYERLHYFDSSDFGERTQRNRHRTEAELLSPIPEKHRQHFVSWMGRRNFHGILNL